VVILLHRCVIARLRACELRWHKFFALDSHRVPTSSMVILLRSLLLILRMMIIIMQRIMWFRGRLLLLRMV
jgi:hypothetical protein